MVWKYNYYYLIPVRKAIIKKSTNREFPDGPMVRTQCFHCWGPGAAKKKKVNNNKCWRGCGEKGTLLHCWWEGKLVQPLRGTVWRFPKKLKIELPYDPAIPLLDIYPEKTLIWKDTCTPMFLAALFTVAKTWKQPKSPWTDEWIKM